MDGQTDTDLPRADDEHGCGWLVAWLAAGTFAVGGGLLALVFVTGNAGPFGIAAVAAGLVAAVGVLVLGGVAAAWLVGRLQQRSGARWRAIAAGLALVAAAAMLAAVVGELAGAAAPLDPLLATVGAVTFTVVAAILAAHREELLPAVAFGLIWVLLVGIVGYRAATDVHVIIDWVGPSAAGEEPTLVAFRATRSGDFELRYRAPSCSDGRVVGSGRYDHRPGPLGSTYGEPTWIELPADILPLRRGDLLRVCLRDGLAAGTAAAEVVSPPSFVPRD